MPLSHRDLARNEIWDSSRQRSAQRRSRYAATRTYGSSPRARWADPTPERAVRQALGHDRDLGDPQHWERSLTRARKRRVTVPRQRRDARRKRNASFALSAAILAGPGGAFAPFADRASAHSQSGEVPAAQVDPQNVEVDAAVAATAGAGERELLRLGDVGEPVRDAQARLAISADGIFGPQTDRAVRDFQSTNRLVVDGIVGPATWSALLAARAQVSAAPASVPADLRVSEITDDGEGGLNVELVAERPERPANERSQERQTPQPRSRERIRAGGPAEQPAPRSRQPSRSVPVAQACGQGALARPVNGPVTSPYGPRGGRTHEGMDIAAPVGTPIRAADCGTVTVAEWQGGYGRMLCVRHSSSLTTCYAHLDRYAVKRGAEVRKGQIIGTVGMTGNTTGPHVHFETRVNGQARNPAPYMSGSRTASSSQATSARSSSTATGGAAPASGGASSSEDSAAGGEPTARKAHSEPQQSEPAPEQQGEPAPQRQSEPAPQQQGGPAPAAQESGEPVQQPAPALEGIAPESPATPETPTEPVEPAEPVDPDEPVLPDEPVTPVEPLEPVDPVEPADPAVEPSELLEDDEIGLELAEGARLAEDAEQPARVEDPAPAS